jgi:hypothetical protein
MGCVEEDDRTVSTGSGSQEKAEAESCRESRNRRRYEKAVGCGESGQGTTVEGRQETTEEIRCQEGGEEECAGEEVRQSMGGHGSPIRLDHHSMAFAPKPR